MCSLAIQNLGEQLSLTSKVQHETYTTTQAIISKVLTRPYITNFKKFIKAFKNIDAEHKMCIKALKKVNI